jgi:galactose oxidase
MRLFQIFVRRSLRAYALLAIAFAFAFVLWPDSAVAQIHEVVVGVTPTCPYGIKACWAGAYHALRRVDGVESVSLTPDAYNCTASIHLKPQTLPDPEKWEASFKRIVDKAYVLRGVELTVEGTLLKVGDGLILRVPGVPGPVDLAPLRHKLQWNFKKAGARQPEPDERDAMERLVVLAKEAGKSMLKVQVTGPFTRTEHGYGLEVREFVRANPVKEKR